ncbi:hypothetical protein [Streptomyces carminius]|uniref:hypothetical protein n=1 Tax=Streptomyces carminius TaxID=2665496 RepID=UPI0011B4FC60|nr:hypothetical protein [Streptomyces carminius]
MEMKFLEELRAADEHTLVFTFGLFYLGGRLAPEDFTALQQKVIENCKPAPHAARTTWRKLGLLSPLPASQGNLSLPTAWPTGSADVALLKPGCLPP